MSIHCFILQNFAKVFSGIQQYSTIFARGIQWYSYSWDTSNTRVFEGIPWVFHGIQRVFEKN